MAALQHQANYHFRPFWDAACKLLWLPKGQRPPGGAWQLGVFDDSDAPGALGYHDFTPSGQPVLKVFAGEDAKYGLSWTVTASHEVLEALADPDCQRAIQVDATKFYALEVGDPVEDDRFAYELGGVKLSNFVLPAWFHPGVKAMRYDHLGLCKAPLELLDGGYQSIFVSGKGWTQVSRFKGKTVDVTHLAGEDGKGLRPRVSADLRRRFSRDELDH